MANTLISHFFYYVLLFIIMTDTISILGKELPLYGLFFYSGIVLAGALSFIPSTKRKIPGFDWLAAVAFAMIGALVGSKLLFIAVSIKDIIRLNLSLYAIIKGGFVFYGGLIGGILGMYIYTRKYKLPTIDYFDTAASVVPLGHAFGRVGCFFAGCCYGMPYSGKFSVTYTATAGLTPLNTPLFPIQLVESFLLIIAFVVLYIVTLKYPQKRGLPTVLYVVIYSVIRFVLEFFRGDKERGGIGFLSTSQIVSLLLLASCVIFLVCVKKRKSYFIN